MNLPFAKEYVILQAALVAANFIYATLLMYQGRYFFGPSKVMVKFIPQVNRTLLFCGALLCVGQFILLIDPFGLLNIYPRILYLFIQSIQYGIFALAFGSYVYNSVKSAFKITFERPIFLWKQLILVENIFVLIVFLFCAVIAVIQNSILFLAFLSFFAAFHALFLSSIATICHIRVITLLQKFVNETSHNPQYLQYSINIVKKKLVFTLIICAFVIGVSFTYGFRYTQEPNADVANLNNPNHFVFIESGLTQVSNVIIFYVILHAGWLQRNYKGGRSKWNPSTPILFPKKSGSTHRTNSIFKFRSSNSEAQRALLSDEGSRHRSSEMSFRSSVPTTSPLASDSDPIPHPSFHDGTDKKGYILVSGNDYPKLDMSNSEGSCILSPEQFSSLYKSIPGNLLIGRCVLHFSLKDDKFELFTQRTDFRSPTIVLLKTSNDEIVGGFASHSWQQRNTFFGVGKAFLFSFQPEFQKYEWSEENEYFMLTLESHITCEHMNIEELTGYFSFANSGPSCQVTGNSSILDENSKIFSIQQLETWGLDPPVPNIRLQT